jgi:hypothetical protein
MSCVIRIGKHGKATLDEGPRCRVQWNRATLLAESHELDPQPLDVGQRPKSGKLRLKPTWHHLEENRLVQTRKQSSWFGEPQCKLGSNTGFNSRILFASYESKLVPRNLDTGLHLKWALEFAQTDLAVSTKLAWFITGSCVLASCHQQEFQEE